MSKPAVRRTRKSGTPPSRSVGKLVGERILTLRLEKGMSLGTLARGTGLTPSFLSKLERGHTSISVDNLRSVAQFLDVEMVSLFQPENESKAVLIPKGSGTPLRVGRTGTFGESLIRNPRSTLQATLYRTPPGEGRPAEGFAHRGEEMVFVLRGRCRYYAGSSVFELREGDALWHLSTEPHGWMNTGRKTSVTLHVNTPPFW